MEMFHNTFAINIRIMKYSIIHNFGEKMNNNTKTTIALFTLPLGSASVIPLFNLVEILGSISKKFTLITGNDGYTLYKDEQRFTVIKSIIK